MTGITVVYCGAEGCGSVVAASPGLSVAAFGVRHRARNGDGSESVHMGQLHLRLPGEPWAEDAHATMGGYLAALESKFPKARHAGELEP